MIKAFDSQATKFLLGYLRKHSLSIIAGMLALIGVDCVQLIIPKIIQQTLDTLGKAPFSTSIILEKFLLIIAIAASTIVLRFLWRLFIIGPSRKIETKLREDMFEHLERLSPSYFNKTKTGDLMALFINDLNSIRMACGMALIGLVDALFLSTMSLFFMFTISVKLTLLTIIPLPAIIFLMIRTGKMIQKRHIRVQESFDAISSQAQETTSGIRLVKSFHQERHEINRFGQLCDTYVKSNISLVKIWGLLFPSITLLGSLASGILIYFGGKQVILQQISIGQFVSFTFYINLLIWPMIATGWVFNMFQRGLASTGRVLELMTTKPQIVVKSTGESIAPLKGNIRFHSLSFRYNEQSPPVLSDINLEIPAGSSLGIVGKAGSGKTTLVSLLFHLYPVNRNQISIDGHDINSIPLSLLRSSIAFVPQDSSLFSDSIRENIAFGINGDIPQEFIQTVAQKASIHKDILNFSQGYYTRIGERGITLSGGQKQRLAIARALLLDSPILVLDDALSAVDSATEREIRTALAHEIRKKTSIIIAHRISTVKDCDKIIVLDDGKISEQGSHEQLLCAGGFYSRLYELQKTGEPVS
jgi:ATP-binding cassette subfamily B protein